MQYDQTMKIKRNDGKFVEFDFNTDIHLVEEQGLIGYVSVYFEGDTVAQSVHFAKFQIFEANLRIQILAYMKRNKWLPDFEDWRSGVNDAILSYYTSVQQRLDSIS